MAKNDLYHLTQDVAADAVRQADARGVRAGPIIAICLLAVLALGVWAWSAGWLSQAFDGVQQSAIDEYSIKIPSNVPTVEPLELKEVPAEIAKKINDATPFTKEPVPPAAPFRIAGDATGIARATDCLAAAVWYEAGAETLAGKKAVAQVVLNRVRHPAYPKSVCGVVFQGQERTTGCQFTFTCDGAMARVPGVDAWGQARGLARIMLNGEVFKPVGVATHYHTDWVLPAWSAKLDKVHKEATHLFFRWTGFWGTPAAFRGRYAGVEPAVRKLIMLSPAHAQMDAGDAVIGDLLALDATLGVPGADGEMPPGTPPVGNGVPANAYGFKPRFQSPSGDFIAFVVPKTTDPGQLLGLVLASCSVKPYCKVLVWTDNRRAPTKMPVTDDQLAAMAFSYLRNRSNGLDKVLWNCDVFPRPDPSQCMKQRVVPTPVVPLVKPVVAAPVPVAGDTAVSQKLRSP